ncbi:MAG: hypothetical protein KC636_01670 [Myxococcales bacterium]|nr:hypothetical protein [Myxococcales bacterium]
MGAPSEPADAEPGATFTLIVHGTFARDEAWWRPGRADAETSAAIGPTFADRLERKLAEAGAPGAVWSFVTEHGMRPEDFSWSGLNWDRDRRAAARALTERLSELASRAGCTPERPLAVNFVAHSHGGNVVLELLRSLPASVRARRVILLGTPLIVYRRSLRLVRAVLALFVVASMTFAIAIWTFAILDASCGVFGGATVTDDVELLLTAGVVVFLVSSWVFVAFAGVIDWLWSGIMAPIDRLRGRAHHPYGPPPEQIRRALGGRQALLVTSHHDEADLFLRLGSKPRKLFNELIRRRWPRIIQALELVLLRPFIDWLAFHLLEALLEHYALGFSWTRCWLADFQLEDIDRRGADPRAWFRRFDATALLRGSTLRTPSLVAPLFEEPAAPLQPVQRAAPERGALDRQSALLIANVREVGRTLSAQIKLLHSRYYENEVLIDLLVADLTREQVDWEAWADEARAIQRSGSGAPVLHVRSDM